MESGLEEKVEDKKSFCVGGVEITPNGKTREMEEGAFSLVVEKAEIHGDTIFMGPKEEDYFLKEGRLYLSDGTEVVPGYKLDSHDEM